MCKAFNDDACNLGTFASAFLDDFENTNNTKITDVQFKHGVLTLTTNNEHTHNFKIDISKLGQGEEMSTGKTNRVKIKVEWDEWDLLSGVEEERSVVSKQYHQYMPEDKIEKTLSELSNMFEVSLSFGSESDAGFLVIRVEEDVENFEETARDLLAYVENMLE